MHVTVRKYAGKGALVDKLVPPVRDGLVPLLKSAPGFKGYCAFGSEDGHIVSVSVFDDQRSATRATDQARDWIASNQRDLLPDPPEVLAGEALLHDVSKLGGGGAEMFAAVRVYEGVGAGDDPVRLTREHVMPVLTAAPGFRGYYAISDERDASRAVSVTLFDTREHAMAAQGKVVPLAREVKIASSPPTIMTGRVVLAASAEG